MCYIFKRHFFGFCGYFLDMFSIFKFRSKTWFLKKNLVSTKSMSKTQFILSGTYFSRGHENTIFLFDPFWIFMIFSILKIAIFQTIPVENTTFRYFSNQKYFKIEKISNLSFWFRKSKYFTLQTSYNLPINQW